MKHSILVTGSIAFDTIMTFPGTFQDHIQPEKAHILSVSFTVDSKEIRDGGTGGNIAYTLALLGESPTLLASSGKDASSYRARLEALGVDVSLWQETHKYATAAATIMTDMADNQITAFYGGAMFAHPGGIPEETIGTYSQIILAPDSTSRMERHAKQLIKANISYIFDPGQSLPGQSKESLLMFLEGASLTILNDYELGLLIEKTGLSEEEIAMRTTSLIVTLGEQGSRARTSEGIIEVGAVSDVHVVDPTGAGDAYRAGLLKGFAISASLERSMKLGAVASAYAIEHAGTQEHTFTLQAFSERLQESFPEEGPLLSVSPVN